MTTEQVHATYEVAKEVFSGTLSRKAGAETLSKKYSINRNSANDLISAFIGMCEGQLYQRSINEDVTAYYLQKIREVYGEESMNNAEKALTLHLSYRQQLATIKLESVRERIVSNNNVKRRRSPINPLRVLNELRGAMGIPPVHSRTPTATRKTLSREERTKIARQIWAELYPESVSVDDYVLPSGAEKAVLREFQKRTQ